MTVHGLGAAIPVRHFPNTANVLASIYGRVFVPLRMVKCVDNVETPSRRRKPPRKALDCK